MSVDDILFSPIPRVLPVRQDVGYWVEQALTHMTGEMEFAVDPDTPIETYLKIAEAIEQNRSIFRAARQLVSVNDLGLRPANALTIKDVFKMIHRGQTDFYWAGKNTVSSFGVGDYQFANSFTIAAGVPMCRMTTGNFELWVLGLLSGFMGFSSHYCFATHDEAQTYWGIP